MFSNSELLFLFRLADDNFLFLRTSRISLLGSMGTYALISTSTPEGKSNLLNASTVREDDV